MALPRGTAKADSGALFRIREAEELAAMSMDDIRGRIRWIRAMLDPEAGGMTYARTRERRIAMRERRQLEAEYSRRASADR